MNILETVLTGVVTGSIIGFFASYFTTKGKYWADLEHLPKLTHDIEEIKGTVQNKILDKIENLKSELAVITNKHNILFMEEKEALFIYYSTFNEWFGHLKIMLSNYDRFNYSELKEIRKKIDDQYDKVQVGMSKLELFLDDSNVLHKAYLLNIAAHEVQQSIQLAAVNLYYNLSSEAFWTEQALKLGLENPNPLITARILELDTDKQKTINDFNNSYPEQIKKVIENKILFTAVAKDYIRTGLRK